MPYSFRPIKPAALKVKSIFSEVESAAGDVADKMLGDYEAGVSTWSHKVEFTKKVTVNERGGVGIEIDTDDEIYLFVHEGTRAHIIRPRRAKRLAFPSGYNAKTQPGRIQSGSGGPFGETVFSGGVNHPGTEGRFFSRPIAKKWDPFFAREMQRAIAKGAKKSGHSI